MLWFTSSLAWFASLTLFVALAENAACSYEDCVKAYNPVSYWRFEETTGVTAHDEMGRHNGTYQGVMLDQPAAPGLGGRSVYFDGQEGVGGNIIVSTHIFVVVRHKNMFEQK